MSSPKFYAQNRKSWGGGSPSNRSWNSNELWNQPGSPTSAKSWGKSPSNRSSKWVVRQEENQQEQQEEETLNSVEVDAAPEARQSRADERRRLRELQYQEELDWQNSLHNQVK
eukprot:GEMP01059936.1.p1 GENE.GEMP01059936.1~~GEMP01059936.1.p1  ORF type:complete len:113 (+),score=21.61 GEMP01059936.1:221-559(+)